MIKGIPLYDGKSESKEEEEFGGIDIHDPSVFRLVGRWSIPLPSNQKYFFQGGQHSTIIGALASAPKCPRFDSDHSQKVWEEKIVKVAEVNQKKVASGLKMLMLELASDKLVLRKKLFYSSGFGEPEVL